MHEVRLRAASPADAEALCAIYAPYVTDTTVTFEYDVPSVEAFRRRMESILVMYPYIVAERDGEMIGYAYAHRFAERAAYGWCAETSIYLSHAHCGDGIGRALYGALLTLLTMQRVQTAYASISAPNPASVALQEAFGFRHVATHHKDGFKLGQWLDTVVYEKPLGGYEIPPAPVIPFPALDAAAVTEALARFSL